MKTKRSLKARNGQMLHEPKWRSRYSNQQRILLVGEGDFSFSSCQATAFGTSTNMVATSLDSRGKLLKKYGKEAESNTLNLSQRGALVFHGFDACKMATKQKNGFQMSNFHRIIFNFPRSGDLRRVDRARSVKKNQELMRDFFANARDMLLPRGQVHVSLKLTPFYDSWKLEEQARVSGLRLVERVPFHREHFPGYLIRRVDGPKQFELDQADTFIFAARIEEPRPASILNSDPVGLSSNMLHNLKALKEKAIRKARASHNLKALKEKAIRKARASHNLKALKEKAIRKARASHNLKALKEKAIRKARASQVTPLQQVVADEVARLEALKEEEKLGKKKMKTLKTLTSALEEMNLENSDPTSVGMSSNMLHNLKALKEKAIRKARASQETPLQQVVADEVARLEALKEEKKLGKKKTKTLKTLKSALDEMNLPGELSHIRARRGA